MAKAKVDIFEEASRKKIGFKTDVGVINVNDLWDLPPLKQQERKSASMTWRWNCTDC